MEDNLNILFLGDMMLGENVYHLGRGIRTKYGQDYPNMILSVIKDKLFDGVDAIICNFEYSLAPNDFDFTDFEKSIYASTVSSLSVLPDNIIKIVNIANNHFWERGHESTFFSINALKQNGFIVVGESSEPVCIEIKGKRLHIWGCSLIDWSVPVFTSTYEKLLKEITTPKSKGDEDIWIMSVHWGTEFIPYPDSKQVELAHQLIEHGFDIVHGHHPHVFQPVETYKNGFIMYSMGNFLFDENFAKETQKSYCIKYSLTERKLDDSLIIINKSYRPQKIKHVAEDKIQFVPGKYWSKRKKRFTSKLYNILRKIEYLPHFADNDFLIYRSLKKRTNK